MENVLTYQVIFQIYSVGSSPMTKTWHVAGIRMRVLYSLIAFENLIIVSLACSTKNISLFLEMLCLFTVGKTKKQVEVKKSNNFNLLS